MSATSASLLLDKQQQKLPRWVNTLLVILLGWALAVLTMKMLPNSQATTSLPTNTVPVKATNKAPDPAKLAQAIASMHLFGNAAAPKPVVKETVVEEKIEQTKLNLKLAGVFAYTPAEKAIAIISAGSGEQNAYGIGDKVSGETTLKSVHADHVVLNNRGKNEKLPLADDIKPITSAAIPQAQVSNNQNTSPSEGGQSNIELPSTPGALRDTLARNPSMLGRIVSAEPYQENGKLLGYRITPKQNPEILEAQGIVAGDVITRVNNIDLNSQKQGIRALRNAVKAQSLDIVVLRDGVEVPLNISLAQ